MWLNYKTKEARDILLSIKRAYPKLYSIADNYSFPFGDVFLIFSLSLLEMKLGPAGEISNILSSSDLAYESAMRIYLCLKDEELVSYSSTNGIEINLIDEEL